MARIERFEEPIERMEQSRLQRFGGRVSRKLDLPWHPGWPEEVQIVPSNACNFRCKACPKYAYETDNRMIPRRVYDRVREQILPWVRRVNLQGLGEPMLSPLFMPMLRDARDLGHDIAFVTNASLFDQDRVREITQSPSRMVISVDGATAKTHTDSRPEADFDQLLSALAMVRDEVDGGEAHPRFEFCVNVVVTLRNLSELEGIVTIAAEHRAKNVQLIAPGVAGREDDFAKDCIGYHSEKFREHFPAVRDHAEKLGIPLVTPLFLQEQPAKGEDGHNKPRQSGRLFPQKCFDPWRTVFIDVDGWVRPCCVAGWIGMGNILEEDFRAIWNNEHYQKLRRSVNSNAPPSFCRGCTTNWGINGGDTEHVANLEKAGIELPPPPSIGVMWDKEAGRLVPAT